MVAAACRYSLIEKPRQPQPALRLLGAVAGEAFLDQHRADTGFEKGVVIKRILPELAQSDEFVAMFIHEAKLAVRLSHANVVQVFDLGKFEQVRSPGDEGPHGRVADPAARSGPDPDESGGDEASTIVSG